MNDQEAALKSLEGKMQVSESGLLFVDGKAVVHFRSSPNDSETL